MSKVSTEPGKISVAPLNTKVGAGYYKLEIVGDKSIITIYNRPAARYTPGKLRPPRSWPMTGGLFIHSTTPYAFLEALTPGGISAQVQERKVDIVAVEVSLQNLVIGEVNVTITI